VTWTVFPKCRQDIFGFGSDLLNPQLIIDKFILTVSPSKCYLRVIGFKKFIDDQLNCEWEEVINIYDNYPKRTPE
jgi:hypothetical protein